MRVRYYTRVCVCVMVRVRVRHCIGIGHFYTVIFSTKRAYLPIGVNDLANFRKFGAWHGVCAGVRVPQTAGPSSFT